MLPNTLFAFQASFFQFLLIFRSPFLPLPLPNKPINTRFTRSLLSFWAGKCEAKSWKNAFHTPIASQNIQILILQMVFVSPNCLGANHTHFTELRNCMARALLHNLLQLWYFYSMSFSFEGAKLPWYLFVMSFKDATYGKTYRWGFTTVWELFLIILLFRVILYLKLIIYLLEKSH